MQYLLYQMEQTLMGGLTLFNSFKYVESDSPILTS